MAPVGFLIRFLTGCESGFRQGGSNNNNHHHDNIKAYRQNSKAFCKTLWPLSKIVWSAFLLSSSCKIMGRMPAASLLFAAMKSAVHPAILPPVSGLESS